MLIKFDKSNNELSYYNYVSEETYRVDDLIILLNKEEFTPRTISSLIASFNKNGKKYIDFNLVLKGIDHGSKDFPNYYQCELSPVGTSYLQADKYTLAIATATNSQEIKVDEYYNAKPTATDIKFENYKIYYESKTDDNISTKIDFTFDRFLENQDLISCQPIIKVIGSDGEKHIQYLNGYKEDNGQVTFSWSFDSFVEKENYFLFALCFITPDNNSFLQTAIYSYSDIITTIAPETEGEEPKISSRKDIIKADSKIAFYDEFEKWMSLRAYYLMEGKYELRDAQNAIEIIDRTINISQNSNTLVKYDHKSELITFKMSRYQDGIDLSKKSIYIKYRNALGETYRSKACNLIVDEDFIYFSWLITINVTKEAGTVVFSVEVSGAHDSDDDWYLWQTRSSSIEVLDTLIFDDDEIYNDSSDYSTSQWYADLTDRLIDIEQKVQEGAAAELTWKLLG